MKREQRTRKKRQENQMVGTKKERLEGFKGGEEMKQKSHMKELEVRKKKRYKMERRKKGEM